MLLVGLTGGIACGKSTVSTMFAELGCFIIEADQVSRKIVEPGEPAYKRVLKTFGPEILNKDRTIDRKRLADIIYNDPAKRKMLNSLLHPVILKEEERLIREAEKNEHEIIMVSAALMIEAGSYKNYDKLIGVYCIKEIQINRLMRREKLSRKDAEKRIQAQLSNRVKKTYADYTINTSGAFSLTRKQVVQVYEKLKRLSVSPRKPRKKKRH